jgi:hypothetical protein
VDVGLDNEDDVNDAVQDMIQQAVDAKLLSAAGEFRLRGMMDNYRDIWAIKLGGHEMADVAPLQIQLTDNAKPVKLPTRVYSPPQKEFMKAKLDELLHLGLIYRNPNSRWASPPLIYRRLDPKSSDSLWTCEFLMPTRPKFRGQCHICLT